MIKRDITAKAQTLWNQYPILTITGPRQSGKTTLAQAAFPKAEYVNLEFPDICEEARTDPRGFLQNHPCPLILDEIQHLPELLNYIQAYSDETRRTGLYVLTGSHQPKLQAAISQSLAGRTALLELLPFSFRELGRENIRRDRDSWIFNGFMPRLYDSDIEARQLYRDYFKTYVERDVRQLVNIRNITGFEKFVRLLAGRVGQVVNLESLGNDAGVSGPTIREWLSVLEASYVIHTLKPYYENFGKRLVKAPKIYFTETGLAAYLIGIRSADQLKTHPLSGNLFENMVVTDLRKQRLNAGLDPDLYFLRTSNGVEVDVVAETDRGLGLIEIKSSSTYRQSMADNLAKVAKFIPSPAFQSVIYAGRTIPSVNGVHIDNYLDSTLPQ